MSRRRLSLDQYDLSQPQERKLARRVGLCVPHRKPGIGENRRPFDDYFVKSDGCWDWLGTIKTNGYGTYALCGKRYAPHRFAYERAHGPIPKGLVVMHSCDNKRCVNLTHLSLGTNADNSADCVAKGRTSHGDNHLTSKLTSADVLEIRRISVKGQRGHPCSWKRLAKRYNVDPTTIRAIVQRRNWRWL